MLHYSDFLRPREDYHPVMTKEALNEKPENWLSFYPHPSFGKILQTLLEQFERGDRSLWITGAYGTGKSHAALVIQKLFMDDAARVDRYCADFAPQLGAPVVERLRTWRAQKVLAVYATGTDTVSTPQQLLMHVEKAVVEACAESGCTVPTLSGRDRLLARIREDEGRFFRKRDEIQDELADLTADIATYVQFEARCRGPFSDGLLRDAERVFEYDNVFLTSEAEQVLDWIDAIRRANGLGKIVFLWDEFSSYIDHAKGDLKTFEKMAEPKAQQCGFHFVPITHTDINAFFTEGSESARKAKDRYVFCPLQIPANQVFRLGAHAFVQLRPEEWKKEEPVLWHGALSVVSNYMLSRIPDGEGVGAGDLRTILPLHPMCAYLLRHLSEKVGSNQRSFFDYLCASSGESEFNRFLSEGGPTVENRQYLTVDYLWHYFMERDDLGRDDAVQSLEAEFRAKRSALKLPAGGPEERVYKAALLYTLMDKKMGAGNQALLEPTVENIARSFEGDGAVVNVEGVLKDLESRNCFSLVGKRVMPLIGAKVDPSPLRDRFTQLVAESVGEIVKRKVDGYGDGLRYEVRAYDGMAFGPSDVKNRERFGEGTPRGGNQVLVNCLLARDREGLIGIPEKARQWAKQFAGLRMAFVYWTNYSFCSEKTEQWEDYIMFRAQASAASDPGVKTSFEARADKILKEFQDRAMSGQMGLALVTSPLTADAEPTVEQNVTWNTLKGRLFAYKACGFPSSPDDCSKYNTTLMKACPSGLKAWAKVGLTGVAGVPGHKTVLNLLQGQDIRFDDAWFKENPTHALTQIRDLLEAKKKNAIGSGYSLRKSYLDLKRAPYGLEQNAFSALVLGFALRPWLEQNLQWTDGRVSQPLDADTLAEIVEKVVQVDGENKISDEKLICRLSREEKAFAKQVSALFGLPTDGGATPESVLAAVGGRLGPLSGNVPLWVLPEYVRSLGTEAAEEPVCTVLQTLCEVLRMSSRSKDGSRTEKVKAIGKCLLDHEGLAEAIRTYVNPESFGKAFDRYLASHVPELASLVQATGDVGGAYRQAVLSRFAQDASWLWNEGDVSGVLADVRNQYRFIRAMQELFAVGSWLEFPAARARLRKALFEDNKVSVALLAGTHPCVGEVASLVKEDRIQGEALERLCGLVETQQGVLSALFRDVGGGAVREILVRSLGGEAADLAPDEWRAVLDSLSNGAELAEEAFRSSLGAQVRAFRSASEGRRLVELWQTRTGSADADDWSRAHGWPADVLFERLDEARFVLGVLRSVGEASSAKIQEASARLQELALAGSVRQPDLFLSRYLPKRYVRVGIRADALARELKARLGDRPNGWLNHPGREDAVQAFVRECYRELLLPQVSERVRAMSEAEAKARLLALVADLPDAGLGLMGEGEA